MSYQRKELHHIEKFDLKLTDGRERTVRFKDKFLIVLDVENHDEGLYVLTTSLKSKPEIRIQLLDTCNKKRLFHYYKFGCNNACDTHSFTDQTFLSGKRGDVFRLSIAKLSELYKPDYSRRKGTVKDDVFIEILKCLKESDLLENDVRDKIKTIHDEEVAKLAAKPTSVVSAEVIEELADLVKEKKTEKGKFSKKDISQSSFMKLLKRK